MANEPALGTDDSDPAAVFACAISLWEAAHTRAASERLNLSELYNGIDELMREVIRVGSVFESWACDHVAFDALNDVWPYVLKDRFGGACLDIMMQGKLDAFDELDCLRVALRLGFPVKLDEKLPVPIDISAVNPIAGAAFQQFRIQTVRNEIDDGNAAQFTADDEPFDEEYDPPYFALYGVGADGVLEHIANRHTFVEAATLAGKLAPGIEFPSAPVFSLPPTPPAC